MSRRDNEEAKAMVVALGAMVIVAAAMFGMSLPGETSTARGLFGACAIAAVAIFATTTARNERRTA